jgi:hypothetical protein
MKLNKKRVVAGITKLITDQTLAIAKREAEIRSARAPLSYTSEPPEHDRTVLTGIPIPISRQWPRKSIFPPACFSWSCTEGLRYPSITSRCLDIAMRQEGTFKSRHLLAVVLPAQRTVKTSIQVEISMLSGHGRTEANVSLRTLGRGCDSTRYSCAYLRV